MIVASGEAGIDALDPPEQTIEQQVVQLIVTGDDVRIRVSPSLNSGVLGHLKSGVRVFALSKEGNWTLVRFVDGDSDKTGWVSSDYLQPA